MPRRRLLLFLIALVLMLPVPVLEVTGDGATYRRLLVPGWPAIITLSYTHSVELTPVEEVYEVRPGGMVMVSMAWNSFGAGLPDTYDVASPEGFSRYQRTPVGTVLSYWFIPINNVALDIGLTRVFEGPDRDSAVEVSVRWLPASAAAAAVLRSSSAPF